MSINSPIDWCDHSFNPWWGCARVSPACRSCYAASWANRYGYDVWRRKGPRRMLSDNHWKQPLRWNRAAEKTGRPALVFCASMADVFEIHPVGEVNEKLDSQRTRLWELIDQTPWLTWQLLTKRPENVQDLAPWGDEWPRNVWLGTSVEDQRRANERIPALASIPAAVRFLSCEPLLEPLDLTSFDGVNALSEVDWVICGGESESPSKARRMDLDWARSLRDKCAASEVPFFFKQTGTFLARELGMHGKGNRWDEIPSELAIRQFPNIELPQETGKLCLS